MTTRHRIAAATAILALAAGGGAAYAALSDDDPAEPAPAAQPGPAAGDARLADLEAARARWEARNGRDYSLRQSLIAFGLPEYSGPFAIAVEDGDLMNVAFLPDGPAGAPPADADVRTVEGLFDEIEDALTHDVSRLEVSYDPETGLPTRVLIDEDELTADEEIGWETSLLGEDPAMPAFDREAAQAALAEARDTWRTTRPASYRLRQEVQYSGPQNFRGPFVIRVNGDQVASVEFAPDGPKGTPPDGLAVLSVDGVFAEIEHALDRGAARVDAVYDPMTGLPTSVWIDQDEQMADEEIGWTLELLES